jgi:hypothetical protein
MLIASVLHVVLALGNWSLVNYDLISTGGVYARKSSLPRKIRAAVAVAKFKADVLMRFQAAVAVAGGVTCLHAFKPTLILENLVDIDGNRSGQVKASGAESCVKDAVEGAGLGIEPLFALAFD